MHCPYNHENCGPSISGRTCQYVEKHNTYNVLLYENRPCPYRGIHFEIGRRTVTMYYTPNPETDSYRCYEVEVCDECSTGIVAANVLNSFTPLGKRREIMPPDGMLHERSGKVLCPSCYDKEVAKEGVWRTQDNREIPIRDMATDHIRRALNYLDNHHGPVSRLHFQYKLLEQELWNRGEARQVSPVSRDTNEDKDNVVQWRDCYACGGDGYLPSLPEGQSKCPYCKDGKIKVTT